MVGMRFTWRIAAVFAEFLKVLMKHKRLKIIRNWKTYCKFLNSPSENISLDCVSAEMMIHLRSLLCHAETCLYPIKWVMEKSAGILQFSAAVQGQTFRHLFSFSLGLLTLNWHFQAHVLSWKMFDTTFHPLLTFTSGFLTLYPRIFQEAAIPGPTPTVVYFFTTLLKLIEPKHQKMKNLQKVYYSKAKNHHRVVRTLVVRRLFLLCTHHAS